MACVTDDEVLGHRANSSSRTHDLDHLDFGEHDIDTWFSLDRHASDLPLSGVVENPGHDELFLDLDHNPHNCFLDEDLMAVTPTFEDELNMLPQPKHHKQQRNKRITVAEIDDEPKKKTSRKNGCLSELKWGQERAASSDETMPVKRPVGISLASGSSSGWRLRISGTQLGHYATAEQAWQAYPRTAERRKTLTQQHHQRTAAAAAAASSPQHASSSYATVSQQQQQHSFMSSASDSGSLLSASSSSSTLTREDSGLDVKPRL